MSQGLTVSQDLNVSQGLDTYDSLSLSPTQLDAGIRLTQAHEEHGVRWVILQAQMQSGKTETYLFDACERLRLHFVKHVVIFSGNAETNLKDQLKKEVLGLTGSKFYGKYEIYLEEIIGLSTRERRPILELIKTNIQVVWGTELKHYTGPTTNTLFIWEESHHAQNINNCPSKFLHNIGISADGDISILKEKNNFVVSISATPFSELSDTHHMGQSKMVVIMAPGINYVSVKTIRDSGRLKGYSKLSEGLQCALSTPHNSPMYAIIRITNKNEETIKSAISRSGWKYVIFDSLSKGEEKVIGENVWNNMDKQPEQDTVILIRGKCRMGKNLEKSHVLFVFETVSNSNTDTVLQGLLGRVCGYSDGSKRIDVWINSKIINSGEIDKYIDMTDGNNIMPQKAMNLVKERISKNVPIIPIKIVCPSSSLKNKETIVTHIYNSFTCKNGVINKNPERESQALLEKIDDAYSNQSYFKLHYLSKNKQGKEKKSYKGLLNKILNGFKNEIASHLGSGCGIDSEGTEINVWIPGDDENIEEKDVIYITAHVPNFNTQNIPKTTQRETFAHGLGDELNVNGNGSFAIELSAETVRSVENMREELDFIINLSLSRPNSNKRINSNGNGNDKEKNKGIIINKEVLTAISPKGVIWKELNQKYGVNVSIVKSRGAVPKVIKDAGLLRLAAIEW
jgi:hypothetical protein